MALDENDIVSMELVCPTVLKSFLGSEALDNRSTSWPTRNLVSSHPLWHVVLTLFVIYWEFPESAATGPGGDWLRAALWRSDRRSQSLD